MNCQDVGGTGYTKQAYQPFLSAEFDGDRCDVEYLQETAGVLLIAMLNMQVFTNSCTTHAEDITSAKVYLDCSG